MNLYCFIATARRSMILLALASGLALPAQAEIGLRAGVHDAFGRLVVSPPGRLAYALDRSGDTLHLRMSGGFGRLARLPPNVQQAKALGDDLALALAPHAAARIWRQGNNLVLDIYAPGNTPPPAGRDAQIVTWRPPPPSPPKPPSPAVPTPPIAAPAKPAAVPPPTPRSPPQAPDLAASLTNGAALLPFGPQTGAAAFRRGGNAVLVFDEAKPLDLEALRADPPFAQIQLAPLPEATRIVLPMPPDRELALTHVARGWQLRLEPKPASSAIRLTGQNGVVAFALQQPGRTLVIDDPDTGGRLLVGTTRQAAQGVGTAYRSPEFALLPSWLGIVVDPLSDRLTLRPESVGFTLRADTAPPLVTSLDSAAAAAVSGMGKLTRQFDFAPEPVPAISNRLRNQLAAAAALPPLERFEPRRQAAETLLALGMGREAAALLHAAVSDDPAKAADPDLRQLAVMAAWLDGAPGPELAPPDNPATDEAALWQALTAPDRTGRSAAIAATWRVLLAYPAPLRERLLPTAADALQAAGNTPELAALLREAAPAELPLVRARALQDQGHGAEALAAFDRIAAGPDRRNAALAVRDAAELRLASGALDAKAAAALLDRHLYDWRGGAPELELRLRVAALRMQAGELRPSLALLRETETLFPDARDRVHDAERSVVAELLRPGRAARLPPLEVVAIAEESADLLIESESGAALAPALVDKLLALDLPDRAAPILERLVAGTTTAAPRAELGLRLAVLRLDRGDAGGARGALRQSAADGLDPALQDRRSVAAARADAALGDRAAALADLATAQSDAALDLRAGLCGAAKDWPGEAAALRQLAIRRLPSGEGTLDAGQRDLVLRLAGALSNAGDMAGLHELRAEQGARMASGRDADLFRVLTGSPVRQVADLPRAAAELAAAQAALPGAAQP